MVSTKWFQGIESKHNFIEVRKNVFCEELKLSEEINFDLYDQFAFNLVIYENEIPAGTGRLLFKDGKYFIDKICVLKEFRGNSYGNLIIRMLIRKAVTIGADKTYAYTDEKYRKLFEKVGFDKLNDDINGYCLMVKVGDVGGHCS